MHVTPLPAKLHNKLNCLKSQEDIPLVLLNSDILLRISDLRVILKLIYAFLHVCLFCPSPKDRLSGLPLLIMFPVSCLLQKCCIAHLPITRFYLFAKISIFFIVTSICLDFITKISVYPNLLLLLPNAVTHLIRCQKSSRFGLACAFR